MTFTNLPTPCYVVDEALIENNLKVLQGVMERTGAKILLAQKAFSMYRLYPLISTYLKGATASGLFEARLGAEELSKGMENHIFSPAYTEKDFEEILTYCDHLVFNSVYQLRHFGPRAKAAGKSVGLRVNPLCSTQEDHAIYDPCAPGSRLGVTLEAFEKELAREKEAVVTHAEESQIDKNQTQPGNDASETKILDLIDGFHFHTLCEQNADALEITLRAVEEQFGKYMHGMKWVNFGGGHHITRSDYDIDLLEKCICHMRDTYGLQVYLEPGEAVALNAGFLVTQVLELIENDPPIAILDTSAACHMPDVLEMPYRPPLKDSGKPGEYTYTYRLGGPTCLAGDIIGEYSFEKPLDRGDYLVFEDMAIYSMVKNNTFNGMPLPAILLHRKDGSMEVVKQFGYDDFKMRL